MADRDDRRLDVEPPGDTTVDGTGAAVYTKTAHPTMRHRRAMRHCRATNSR